jgi:hypothetical protein
MLALCDGGLCRRPLRVSFVPLVIVAVFAFNDANYPAPPWRDSRSIGSRQGANNRPASSPTRRSEGVATSALVACWVTARWLWAIQRFPARARRLRGKSAVSLMMLAPLAIPGVIHLDPRLREPDCQFADDTLSGPTFCGQPCRWSSRVSSGTLCRSRR